MDGEDRVNAPSNGEADRIDLTGPVVDIGGVGKAIWRADLKVNVRPG
jgi:hypothetical protein